MIGNMVRLVYFVIKEISRGRFFSRRGWGWVDVLIGVFILLFIGKSLKCSWFS